MQPDKSQLIPKNFNKHYAMKGARCKQSEPKEPLFPVRSKKNPWRLIMFRRLIFITSISKNLEVLFLHEVYKH